MKEDVKCVTDSLKKALSDLSVRLKREGISKRAVALRAVVSHQTAIDCLEGKSNNKKVVDAALELLDEIYLHNLETERAITERLNRGQRFSDIENYAQNSIGFNIDNQMLHSAI